MMKPSTRSDGLLVISQRKQTLAMILTSCMVSFARLLRDSAVRFKKRWHVSKSHRKLFVLYKKILNNLHLCRYENKVIWRKLGYLFFVFPLLHDAILIKLGKKSLFYMSNFIIGKYWEAWYGIITSDFFYLRYIFAKKLLMNYTFSHFLHVVIYSRYL